VARVEAGPADRVVRRYDNRKLYDTRARAYVTIDDLARLIAAGEDVVVLDQRSGEDLTTLILAQILLESIRGRTASIPRQVLTRLIRLSKPEGALAHERNGPLDAAARALEEAERIVAGLLRRGRLPLEEALALRQEIASTVQRVVAEAQRTLEAKLHSLVERSEKEGGVSPAIQALKERLMTLETYLGGGGRGRRPRRRRPAET
jgi:polyhydroxyalkanoate synthesis repressor PhaR